MSQLIPYSIYRLFSTTKWQVGPRADDKAAWPDCYTEQSEAPSESRVLIPAAPLFASRRTGLNNNASGAVGEGERSSALRFFRVDPPSPLKAACVQWINSEPPHLSRRPESGPLAQNRACRSDSVSWDFRRRPVHLLARVEISLMPSFTFQMVLRTWGCSAHSQAMKS